MLAKLTVKPLLIAIAVLSAALMASGYANVRLLKQVGAAKAECEATKSLDTNNRNVLVNSLAENALRDRVTQLESELKAYRDQERAAELRASEVSQLLTVFKDEVDEARKVDSHLDAPADVTRLRNLEAAYQNRVRAKRSNQVPVSPNSSGPTS